MTTANGTIPAKLLPIIRSGLEALKFMPKGVEDYKVQEYYFKYVQTQALQTTHPLIPHLETAIAPLVLKASGSATNNESGDSEEPHHETEDDHNNSNSGSNENPDSGTGYAKVNSYTYPEKDSYNIKDGVTIHLDSVTEDWHYSIEGDTSNTLELQPVAKSADSTGNSYTLVSSDLDAIKEKLKVTVYFQNESEKLESSITLTLNPNYEISVNNRYPTPHELATNGIYLGFNPDTNYNPVEWKVEGIESSLIRTSAGDGGAKFSIFLNDETALDGKEVDLIVTATNSKGLTGTTEIFVREVQAM